MKFKIGDKVKFFGGLGNVYGIGRVVCQEHPGLLGVQFPKIQGHSLNGLVDSGGWLCYEEYLVLASPITLENK